jgi:hypothetical protein
MYEEQRIEPLTIYRDIRTGCGREIGTIMFFD